MLRTLLAAVLLATASLVHAADPRVELKTSLGVIVLELSAEKAPKTVANFLQYVKDGHYNGTVFHRVIDGFMIQGGGFEPGMKQKATRAPIENEARNGLRNDAGTIAMARTSDPNSATAQFFINVANNDALNHPRPDGHGYAVFGRVVQGMDVVNRIKAVRTGNRGPHQNVPVEDVVIESATVLPAK
jgi:peptidyl-prolyl cis-trans isomerase A (cyclophilin A)